jgi:hypothetical protein
MLDWFEDVDSECKVAISEVVVLKNSDDAALSRFFLSFRSPVR